MSRPITRPINRLTLTAALAAMAVSLAAPMAVAQGKSTAPGCMQQANGQMQCTQPQARQAKAQPQAPAKAQPQQQAKAQYQAQPQAKAHGPAVGDSARRAPVLQQARVSRLPAPPAHQHYRVLNDTVVRVDDTTLAVVSVIGLASALLSK